MKISFWVLIDELEAAVASNTPELLHGWTGESPPNDIQQWSKFEAEVSPCAPTKPNA